MHGRFRASEEASFDTGPHMMRFLARMDKILLFLYSTLVLFLSEPVSFLFGLAYAS